MLLCTPPFLNVSFQIQFMQRTEEAKLRHQLEEEEKREIDEAHWVLDKVNGVEDEYV